MAAMKRERERGHMHTQLNNSTYYLIRELERDQHRLLSCPCNVCTRPPSLCGRTRCACTCVVGLWEGEGKRGQMKRAMFRLLFVRTNCICPM